ncbi:uncharacterized protein K444DRAFT_609094 [Hyaloscypha bicolor E]|uniref:Uncharacterized protein n=1 Tax=Hyaloscypha bicolor E TaxID=1095630 RepID=A0A2J6TN59_9HELO|nr:uncharacterized protein K444DRAFT_609094 [Hyaloscypha bicolor E]PMD64388.1 hypothetical protein K444DRAFT_609094 [Hyaloscypha bicolor E]
MELWEALWLALKIPLAAFSGKGYCVARYFGCYALERCGLLRWPLSLGPGLHSAQLAMDWFSHLLGLRLVIPLTLTLADSILDSVNSLALPHLAACSLWSSLERSRTRTLTRRQMRSLKQRKHQRKSIGDRVSGL